MGRAATLLALLSASCVGSSSNVCEDGSICPGGFVCDVPNDRCLLPEQIRICTGLENDADCEFENAPGKCREGACIPFFCGDRYVTEEVGEECEPTQTADELSKDCIDFGFYSGDGLECTPSCTYYLGDKIRSTGCFANEYCGDTEINGNELCDGPEIRTCVSIGFDAGTTSCNGQCGFSIGDCSRFGWNPESLSDVVALAVAGSGSGDQWAFGMNGRAMRFEGAFWNTVPTGVQNTLINGWSFASTDTWAVGQSRASGPTLQSIVIRFDGVQWSTVSGVPGGEYIDVWGPASNEVYVATTGSILKYNGTVWSTLPSPGGEPIAMRGTSGNDIWVATKAGPLKHFNGASWFDRTPTGYSIQFLDANAANDVWAIGFLTANQGTGVIAHWNGTMWDLTWEVAQERYNAIAASAPNDAWIAGIDGIMRHWDGVAWSRSANVGSSPSGLTAISGMISLGAGQVLAVSTLNLAYRFRGQAFGLFHALGPNPFDATENTAIWGTSAGNQYVTNVNGEVWHYNGTTWTLVFTTPANSRINGIAGGSATDIWIVAQDGSAYQNTGGAGWTPFAVAGIPLTQVWIHADGDVWVFGANGGYHKNGTAWDYTAFGTGIVEQVSGSAPDNIWVVQRDPATLWQYDGTNWTEVPTGATFPVIGVAALSKTDIHVTAEEGRFLHSDGSTWTETVLPVLADMHHITYTAADDVIAASERDLAHFNGTAWSTMRTPVDFVPNTADFLPIIDLQATPGRIDMLQRKYRVRTLIRTKPLICRDRDACGDSVDNDCDGDMDALDADGCI